MIYGTILCIGDSLLNGARDEDGLSVPMILGDILSKNGQKWVVVNECVNGETSGNLVRRFYKTIKSYPEVIDVVLCIGINDAKIPAVSLKVFKRNYSELLRILAIMKKHCFPCLIPKRDGFGAPDYIDSEAINSYNDAILELISTNETAVDLRNIPRKFRADGVHLNLGGDKWAAKKIASIMTVSRS